MILETQKKTREWKSLRMLTFQPATLTYNFCGCGQQFPWNEQVILVLEYVAEAASS